MVIDINLIGTFNTNKQVSTVHKLNFVEWTYFCVIQQLNEQRFMWQEKFLIQQDHTF